MEVWQNWKVKVWTVEGGLNLTIYTLKPSLTLTLKSVIDTSAKIHAFIKGLQQSNTRK